MKSDLVGNTHRHTRRDKVRCMNEKGHRRLQRKARKWKGHKGVYPKIFKQGVHHDKWSVSQSAISWWILLLIMLLKLLRIREIARRRRWGRKRGRYHCIARSLLVPWMLLVLWRLLRLLLVVLRMDRVRGDRDATKNAGIIISRDTACFWNRWQLPSKRRMCGLWKGVRCVQGTHCRGREKGAVILDGHASQSWWVVVVCMVMHSFSRGRIQRQLWRLVVRSMGITVRVGTLSFIVTGHWRWRLHQVWSRLGFTCTDHVATTSTVAAVVICRILICIHCCRNCGRVRRLLWIPTTHAILVWFHHSWLRSGSCSRSIVRPMCKGINGFHWGRIAEVCAKRCTCERKHVLRRWLRAQLLNTWHMMLFIGTTRDSMRRSILGLFEAFEECGWIRSLLALYQSSHSTHIFQELFGLVGETAFEEDIVHGTSFQCKDSPKSRVGIRKVNKSVSCHLSWSVRTQMPLHSNVSNRTEWHKNWSQKLFRNFCGYLHIRMEYNRRGASISFRWTQAIKIRNLHPAWGSWHELESRNRHRGLGAPSGWSN